MSAQCVCCALVQSVEPGQFEELGDFVLNGFAMGFCVATLAARPGVSAPPFCVEHRKYLDAVLGLALAKHRAGGGS